MKYDGQLREGSSERSQDVPFQHGQTPDSTYKNYEKGDNNLSKSR